MCAASTLSINNDTKLTANIFSLIGKIQRNEALMCGTK
jgi:hypothetical protein